MKALLMGGQACVLYGAAEFSRDTDLAIVADAENLSRLRTALAELKAERIAVQPFEQRYLDLGLAVHFRCAAEACAGIRIDVMSQMRGVDGFDELWSRRTTLESGEETIELLSLPDLVRAKKTQRDKDWPMIVRLVEAHYFAHRTSPTQAQLQFWLNELRTPELLIDVAAAYPEETKQRMAQRQLLVLAAQGASAVDALRQALIIEEQAERAADREYWRPLRAELERLRRESRN